MARPRRRSARLVRARPNGSPNDRARAGDDAQALAANVAARLVDSYVSDSTLCIQPGHGLPVPQEVREVVIDLRELVFPGYATGRRPSATAMRTQVEALVAQVRVRLVEQLFRGLHARCKEAGRGHRNELEAHRICDAFLSGLPELRAELLTDVQAAYDGDPAAGGADEVVFSYPGVQAICSYRVAHRLHRLGALIVPRMITELAHSETGIDIHPGATIGESFFIDHGTGVVIGETSVIGRRVRIYQGVTLGALSLPSGQARSLARKKRHPTIEDDVIIYANATILGGETVIGRGAVIGGNCWVTHSVPAMGRRSREDLGRPQDSASAIRRA